MYKIKGHIFTLAYCCAIVACTTPGAIKPTDLRGFTSDGCSHYPEGTVSEPELWEACCVAHDRDYWAGGNRDARVISDKNLKRCVQQTGGGKLRSKMMWMGVRLGGAPWFPSSYRWSYGWPYYRGYKSITAEEQAQINRKAGL